MANDLNREPEEKCEAAKNKLAGKYSQCRQLAHHNLVKSSDLPKYEAMIAKCEAKFAADWQKAEDKAARAGGICLDSLLPADVKSVIDGQSASLAAAFHGDALLVCKPAPGVCGCGVPDIDADHDGVYTCQGDTCDSDPTRTTPGPCD